MKHVGVIATAEILKEHMLVPQQTATSVQAYEYAVKRGAFSIVTGLMSARTQEIVAIAVIVLG
jgi:hypothetical protein